MISESEVFVRDTVRINVLKEVRAESVKLAFRLNDGTIEDYLAQIHNENSRVRVYGNFNISESPNGETVTIRPIAPDNKLKIVPTVFGSLSEKKISVIRSATKTEDSSYEFHSGLVSLELIPSNGKYILRVEYSDNEVQAENVQTAEPAVSNDSITEQHQAEEIPPVSEQSAVPAETNQTAAAVSPEPQSEEERRQKIEEEYHKDYEQAQAELEEYQKRFEIDASVLEYYKDKDVTPIEDILKAISEKLDEAEQQIRLFIEAKQKKTMEIEGEIKSNRK